MNGPSFLIAFGIGVLSFFAPCTLPVLPGYFSYLAGVSYENDNKNKKVKIFFSSFFFVLGFSLVLIILGATASAIGQFFAGSKIFWEKISGLLVIIFGLQTIGLLKLSFLQKGRIMNLEKVIPWEKGKAFLAGSSFGISWIPCIGPTLGSILILAGQTQTLTRGIGLLVFYSLGLAIPMLFSGFFIGQLKFIHLRFVSFVSGGILIALGFLLFFGHYTRLTVWTSQVYKYFNIRIL